MSSYTVYIQVIRVYSLDIEAESEEEALNEANKMDSLQIAEEGILKDVSTDYAEIM